MFVFKGNYHGLFNTLFSVQYKCCYLVKTFHYALLALLSTSPIYLQNISLFIYLSIDLSINSINLNIHTNTHVHTHPLFFCSVQILLSFLYVVDTHTLRLTNHRRWLSPSLSRRYSHFPWEIKPEVSGKKLSEHTSAKKKKNAGSPHSRQKADGIVRLAQTRPPSSS